MLDFGYVILGTIKTHRVVAKNVGHFPVSFSPDRATLERSGFQMDLSRVRQLPGAPEHEEVDFVVSCDPRGANIDVGPIEALAVITV